MSVRESHSRGDVERDPLESPAPVVPNVVAALWRDRLLILAALAVAVLCAGLYLVVTPARYMASTSILIDPKLGRGIGGDPNQPGFVSDTSAVDSQVKLLTSQTVLARVGKLAMLAEDPEFNGAKRSLWARLTQPAPVSDGGTDLKTLEDAITIKRPERTYVVEVQVLAKGADKAAQIANAVVQAYVDDQIQARIDAAESDGRFVQQRLEDLQAQIKAAQTKVEDYKAKNNIVTASGLRSNEQQVADLTRSLGEARAKASDAKARRDEILLLSKSGQLSASGDALKSQTIERLRAQQAEIARDAAKLSRTLGERHPALQEARRQQQEIGQLITEELKRVATSATADWRIASRNEAQIVAEVDRLKSQSNVISGNLIPLAQLERDVESLRGSYERFSKIRDTLSEQEADSAPARVIAVARAPVSPSVPKKSVVALVALIGGVFVGVALALAREGLRVNKITVARAKTAPAKIAPAETAPAKTAPAKTAPAPAPATALPKDAARPRQGITPLKGSTRATSRYWDDRLDDARS